MTAFVGEGTWTARRVNRTALVTMAVMVVAWSVDGRLADVFCCPAAFGFLIGTTLLTAVLAF
jgi:hypothetical protein